MGEMGMRGDKKRGRRHLNGVFIRKAASGALGLWGKRAVIGTCYWQRTTDFVHLLSYLKCYA